MLGGGVNGPINKNREPEKPPVKPHGDYRDDCKSSSLFFVSIHSPERLTVQRYEIFLAIKEKIKRINYILTRQKITPSRVYAAIFRLGSRLPADLLYLLYPNYI